MVKVIMISGLKGAGKDYVAKLLSEQIEGSKVMILAEPLKDIIATTLGVTREELNEYKNESRTLSLDPVGGCYNYEGLTNFRTILQRFGTEAMKKHFGNEVWVDLLIKNLPSEGVVIVSDWRFITEVKAISKIAKVITLRVDDFNLVSDGHASEEELMTVAFDHRVNNTHKDSSITALVDEFVSMYGLRG